MTELNVQPKKKASPLPWILLVLGAIALVWFLTRDREDTAATPTVTDTTPATVAPPVADNTRVDWNVVDFNAPSLRYDEITNTNVTVRGSGRYGIYTIDETVLFDQGQADIRSNAEAALAQVASSIGKRYNKGSLRVYGYTDAQGSAAANDSLAHQRAIAVKNWLQNNGVDANRITVNAVGEANPVATNTTEKGRQQNRRVEIVALSADTAYTN